VRTCLIPVFLMAMLYPLSTGAANLFFLTSRFLRESPSREQALLSQAVKWDPFQVEYRTLLATRYYGEGDYERAREEFSRTLRHNHKLPNSYYFLALLAQARGDEDQAEEYFEKATFLDPVDYRKGLAYVRFLHSRNDTARALLLCRSLAEKMLDNLFICLNHLSTPPLALADQESMVPKDPVARTKFAQYLWKRGRFQDFNLYVRQWNRETDPTPQSLLLLVQAAQSVGKVSEAIFFAQAALKHFPYHRDLVFLLGELYRREKLEQETLALYRRQMEIEDFDFFWVQKVMGILEEQKDAAGVEVLLLQATQRRPHSLEIQGLLAANYVKEENYSQAISIYKDLISKGYALDANQEALAYVYVQNRSYPQAIAQLERLLNRAPKRVDLILKLGDLYQSLGHREKAREYYERILRITPDHALARERLKVL
jgi:Tfp pilus assembly protein PilF